MSQLHGNAREVSGINTRAELAEFENLMRRSTIRKLMVDDGVTFSIHPTLMLAPRLSVGRDCIIYPGVSIEGKSIIGEGCEIQIGHAHHEFPAEVTTSSSKITVWLSTPRFSRTAPSVPLRICA